MDGSTLPGVVNVPGQDNGAYRKSLLESYFLNPESQDLVGLVAQLKAAKDTPGRTELIAGEKGHRPPRDGGSSGGSRKSGETNIVQILRLAERMGLHVGEHPKFDKVDPVHTSTSNHYANHSGTGGDAGDVSGSPELMEAFARKIARRYGADLEELIWRGKGARTKKNGKHVPASFFTGHKDHVHVADRD